MPDIPIDTYVVDTLLRDLVGHSRKASQFLVYLFLWRHTHGAAKPAAAFSHAAIAEGTGLSKRAAQEAVYALSRRKLIEAHRSRPTAVPRYTVLRPWLERGVKRAGARVN